MLWVYSFSATLLCKINECVSCPKECSYVVLTRAAAVAPSKNHPNTFLGFPVKVDVSVKDLAPALDIITTERNPQNPMPLK